jgi:hypothetical protein
MQLIHPEPAQLSRNYRTGETCLVVIAGQPDLITEFAKRLETMRGVAARMKKEPYLPCVPGLIEE